MRTLLLLALGAAASAANTTITWTDGASGGGHFWSEPTNWSPALAPSLTKDLVFTTGPASGISTNDLVDDAIIGRISILGRYWDYIGPSTTTKMLVADEVYFDSDQNCNLVMNLSGSCDIQKHNLGTLALSGASTFTGPVLVWSGRVVVNSNGALGSPLGATSVASGGALELAPSSPLSLAEPLSLWGPGDGTIPTLNANDFYTGVMGSCSGPITLVDATVAIGVTGSGAFALTGTIDGAGGFTKVGTGTLQLLGSSANTAAGTTSVTGGRLQVGRASARAFAGPVTIGTPGALGPPGAFLQCMQSDQFGPAGSASGVFIAGDGQLEIGAGQHQALGALKGGGNVTLADTAATLEISDHAVDEDSYAGAISGPGLVIMDGDGRQSLAGANTYSGQTIIAHGTLGIFGAQPGSDVHDTGAGELELAGPSAVGAVTIHHGGLRLFPGQAHSKSLDLQGPLEVILDGVAPGDRGSLSVTGTVMLTGSALSGTSDFGAVPPAAGTVLTLIANDGVDAVVGHFAGAPEGATVVVGSWEFTVSYVGGDGNDVTLTVLRPVPSAGGGKPKPWWRLNPVQAGKRCGLGGAAAVLLLPAFALIRRRRAD